MGTALIPKILCYEELNEGKLVQVLPSLAIEKPNIYAVYPSRNHRSKALTDFIGFIETELQKLEYMDK